MKKLLDIVILATVLAVGVPYFQPLALASGQVTLVPAGSSWNYWDKTNYPGDAWRALGFDDSGWSTGPAMLGFGDANGVLPTTVAANSGLLWTAYFRRTLVVPDGAAYTNFVISLQRDDGAVVWLNGVELWRDNMPAGTILQNTPASTTVGGTDETRFFTNNLNTLALGPGTNIIAVEVHQSLLSSSDLLFDFALTAEVVGWPDVAVPSDRMLTETPASIQLTATVRDDGLPLPANPGAPDPNDPNKLRWGWSVVLKPDKSAGVVWSGTPTNGAAFTYAGSPNPPGTLFTCDPTATFDVPGVYVLEFRASDGAKSESKQMTVSVTSSGNYRQLGYLYLSPLPGAEYCAPQTRFLLVRFKDVAPTAVSNLSSFIKVTGASSGIHAGQTKIAGDGRTVIFTMTSAFAANELVTVSMTPLVTSGTVQPYQYQFMVSGHMPDPPTVTARGDNPPNQTKEKAFDGDAGTKWVDLVVPNGSANFSWIQHVYTGSETHRVTQYAITSAGDAPERDPKDWSFYGVDAATNLTLLDARTNQTFSSRLQTNTYSFANTSEFRGYRLQITKVANPATATGVQLAELAFFEPAGSILREYWTGIPGTAVSALTSNANYPDNPSGRDQLTRFEAPTDWADNYGTRVRGYLTAPVTGSYVFWIASDDNGELWLSTNEDPANKAKIATVPGWASPRQWTVYAEQKSPSISLVAGQKYYIEALQKEEGGGDNLAVGWAKPSQATSAPSEVIPGWALSPWTNGISLAAFAAAPRQSLSVVTPEEVVTSFGNGVGTLSVASPGKTGILSNGVSVPSDFPWIAITTNSNPDPNPIFIDNRGGNGKPYNVIFDNNGSPIWYKRMPAERRDMKVQHNGMLTMLTSYGFVGLNNHYEETTSYLAVNGYSTNDHELQVLEDGTYLLIGDHSETVDLSRYVSGGSTSAGINENCIQEFTPQGELIFQWRAWDHLDVAGQQYVVTTTNPGDFPHMNAVAVDTDGHILLSSRNTSEVTKINRDTGEVIWRLGGIHNQFAFVNDPLNGQRNQHAIRPLGNNRYTLFDNGNGHSPQVSRALEYELNPSNMTATIVWQYPATPTTSLFSFYMGNAQRLLNGNTLINWAVGSLPKLTEVRPDGTKAFEMNWVNGYEAYRVWRCPWQGVALKPYLILESYPDNVTLLFNQFGDTNVVTYRIYGGTSPQPTNLLAVSGTTLRQLTNLQNGQRYYFRVTAVSRNGVEGDFSNEENVSVNIIKPGQNMLSNGDFASGTASWVSVITSPAAATWTVTSGVSGHVISNGGSAISAIQMKQTGFPLILGNKYVLEFDAWAGSGAGTRYIEAKVQNSSASLNYYTKTQSLTLTKQHFRYDFTMQSASDFSAQLVFNLGASTRTVYLDNIVLFNSPPGDLNLDGRVDLYDLKTMSIDWRKQQAGLSPDLDGDGKIDFKDFGILGENWSSGP